MLWFRFEHRFFRIERTMKIYGLSRFFTSIPHRHVSHFWCGHFLHRYFSDRAYSDQDFFATASQYPALSMAVVDDSDRRAISCYLFARYAADADVGSSHPGLAGRTRLDRDDRFGCETGECRGAEVAEFFPLVMCEFLQLLQGWWCRIGCVSATLSWISEVFAHQFTIMLLLSWIRHN